MEVCRLCLNLLQGDNFRKLDDLYKGIIKNIIPKVKFDLFFQPVICNQCSVSVDESNQFKKLCLESQQQLRQKLKGEKKSKLTAQEILRRSSGDGIIDKAKERICQTCLESIERESFTILNPSNPDAYLDSMLTMCLSELDLRIFQDPVMCEKCLNSLQKFYHFKTTCLEVEEKLKRYSISHGTIAKFPFSLFSVLESFQDCTKTGLKPSNDQVEKLDIKTEKQDNAVEESKDMDACFSLEGCKKNELKLSNIADVKGDKLDIKTEKPDDVDMDNTGLKDMGLCQEEMDIKLEE